MQKDLRQELESLTGQLRDTESKLQNERVTTEQLTNLQLEHSKQVDSLKQDYSNLESQHTKAVCELQSQVDSLTAEKQELLVRVEVLESPDSNQTIKQLQATHREAIQALET